MKTQQQDIAKNKAKEIYSISGFKDTLASPVFYPVIVVALVLGLTSIFGFVQNPLKLKSIVNVIHQKVATTNVVSSNLHSSVNDQLYDVFETKQSNTNLRETKSIKTFNLFSHVGDSTEKMAVDKEIERIAFNYDLTSENFWSELDSSKLESASEEMERKEKEANSIGAPLELNKLEKLPSKFKLNNDSIYALSKKNQL